MRITHSDAISLESVVRRVFACDRAGMGGYIDADHFESAPFDAALIALAPLWQKADVHEIEEFCLSGNTFSVTMKKWMPTFVLTLRSSAVSLIF